MKQIRKRLTYANVMSSLAVFLVIGGASAVAAGLAKNSVGAKQLKSNAVTAAKIKKNAVTGAKIKDKAITGTKIADGAVTGAKVDVNTLGTVPKANAANTANSANTANTANTANSAGTWTGYSRKTLRLSPTTGATKEAAAAAAPETAMFSAGPFTVYAKCLLAGTTLYGVTYIKTSEGGAIFDSDEDSAEGEPFLEPGTPEDERELVYESTGADSADYWGVHSPEFTAMAGNGTTVRGDLQVGVKNGELASGNGLYGAGSVCLIAGEMTALNG